MIESHGFYTTISSLSNQIRADTQHLERAPLGPIQKKRLAERIAYAKQKLKEARVALREFKRRQKEVNGGGNTDGVS